MFVLIILSRPIKKVADARRAMNRSFGFAQDRLPQHVPKSNQEGGNASLHYSITPVFQFSSTLE